MGDDEAIQEAREFEEKLRAGLEGFDRIRRLRGVFLDGIVELEVAIDDLICTLLHIEPGAPMELFRAAVLPMPLRAKIDGLAAMLDAEEISSAAIRKKLLSLAEKRDMFAHAKVGRESPSGEFKASEPVIFTRHWGGKVNTQPFTESELEDQIKRIWPTHKDLDAVSAEIVEHRAGRIWIYAVTASGTQAWNDRPLDEGEAEREINRMADG